MLDARLAVSRNLALPPRETPYKIYATTVHVLLVCSAFESNILLWRASSAPRRLFLLLLLFLYIFRGISFTTGKKNYAKDSAPQRKKKTESDA